MEYNNSEIIPPLAASVIESFMQRSPDTGRSKATALVNRKPPLPVAPGIVVGPVYPRPGGDQVRFIAICPYCADFHIHHWAVDGPHDCEVRHSQCSNECDRGGLYLLQPASINAREFARRYGLPRSILEHAIPARVMRRVIANR